MSENNELDALLAEGEETGAVETQEAEVAEQEASQETAPEVEAKAEETTTEEKAEVTPTEETQDEPWTKKGYLEEKRKRQELERKLQELEQGKVEEQRPDVFEDQEAAFNFQRQQTEAQIKSVKLELAQDMMREIHQDYDELEYEFIDLAKDNPALAVELNNASNPARYAYETAKKAREAAELKDIDAYKEKLKAEMKESLMAELKAEQEKSSAKNAEKEKAISTPSLAAVKGTGGHVDDGDDSLESLTRLG